LVVSFAATAAASVADDAIAVDGTITDESSI